MFIPKTLRSTKQVSVFAYRSFSTTKKACFQELDTLHQGHHYSSIPKRYLLEMEGPDSSKFLQGLITNYMPLISAGGDGFYSAFLTPQGRMLYDVFIYPVNVGENFPHPKYIIDAPLIPGNPILKHLKRYILRSKVKIKDVSEDYQLYHIWGNKSHKPSSLSSTSTSIVEPDVPTGTLIKKNNRLTDIGCEDPRVHGFGYRAVVPKDQDISTILHHNDQYTELSSNEYTVRRILHGIPEGTDDIWPEQSLPLESNLDYMNGVDFRKGCYIGQELTIRTYHTGVVRKRIVPFQIYKDDESAPTIQSVDRQIELTPPIQPQTDIKLNGGSNKRSVGKIGSTIHNIGLALMRLEQVQKCEQGDPISFRIPDTNYLIRPFLPSWWSFEDEDK
ncbi:unnamed protein product [Cunninghamella echinulata]